MGRRRSRRHPCVCSSEKWIETEEERRRRLCVSFSPGGGKEAGLEVVVLDEDDDDDEGGGMRSGIERARERVTLSKIPLLLGPSFFLLFLFSLEG